MQISTSLFYDTAATRMSQMNQRASVLQTQIATGKKIQQASDDPNAASQIAELDRKDADAAVYGTNLTMAGSLLDQASSVISQINTQLTRATELATQAGNGTQTDASRQSIGVELKSIVDAIVGLANSTNVRGQPLFGTPGGTQAVTANADGSYAYATTNVSEVPIADGQTVQATESATRLFKMANGKDTLSVLSNLASALQAGGDVSDTVSSALTDLKAGIDQVANVQASVGARGARVDLQQQLLTTANTDRADLRQKLESVDTTQAIVELQQMMTALSATQASFSKLSNLSLFDYLK
ncbi:MULTISPECIES: flagellar hook-associated protein 3 [Sphingomonas]|jgi:flagellar hook-associated protein 3 FlgL|uniref:flagellin N-terminal helical domain-containing protein n=1 Tax=Sphingomonas TaxID=13687 RepID=UPI001AEF2384|nr:MULTISPECIES: flagellar hook-associated protein 3 [Sphingomonas]